MGWKRGEGERLEILIVWRDSQMELWRCWAWEYWWGSQKDWTRYSWRWWLIENERKEWWNVQYRNDWRSWNKIKLDSEEKNFRESKRKNRWIKIKWNGRMG